MPSPNRFAGVGRSINDACALARASKAAGADALMVHQPPDPFVSPRGVIAYVQRIAEAGGGLISPSKRAAHVSSVSAWRPRCIFGICVAIR